MTHGGDSMISTFPLFAITRGQGLCHIVYVTSTVQSLVKFKKCQQMGSPGTTNWLYNFSVPGLSNF